MDYLQYINTLLSALVMILMLGFKPYYKWITFNTTNVQKVDDHSYQSFKPYYKWITFNT